MNNEVKTIPFIVYESTVDRLERVCRRLWILCIVIFLCFVASNTFWIWYDKQYEDTVTTITQEAENESGSITINGTGNINGEGKTNNND